MNYEKLTKTKLIAELIKLNQEIDELKKMKPVADVSGSEQRISDLKTLIDEGNELLTEKNKEVELITGKHTALVTENTNLLQLVIEKDNGLKLLKQQSDAPIPSPVTTIVFPYVSRFAQGNELLHAIRGWSENFNEDFKIVVVGDKEDWFADSILHIPHECNTKNPPLDIVEKMKLVIAHEDVPEEFIWTNDDIYPINAVSLVDLKLLKCDGNLAKGHTGGGVYATNRKRTFELLKSLKRPTYNYATHTPMVFEKSKLQLLIKMYHIDDVAYLVSCLYFNFFFADMIPFQLNIDSDNIKCGVYRPNPNMKIIESALTSKKFINNSQSGYVKPLVELLDKRFSTPCEFECETEKQE